MDPETVTVSHVIERSPGAANVASGTLCNVIDSAKTPVKNAANGRTILAFRFVFIPNICAQDALRGTGESILDSLIRKNA